MSKAVNLVGENFGWLRVLARAGSTPRRQATWLCRCRCGREKLVVGHALRIGAKRSCGECKNESTRPRLTRTVIDGRNPADVEFLRS